jgi:hypothetical protein
MEMSEIISKKYSVIIVGGGISGICAALSCARHGTKTALIHDRPVLGGNASSEIRMHICGAGGFMNKRPDSRETGILEELLLENRYRNPQHSFSVFDTVLWEKVRFQENLDLFLNTHMTDVVTENNTVTEIKTVQLTTEKTFSFTGNIFIDTTGDASLAYFGGADFRVGREAGSEFNEKFAQKTADEITMGNTIMFKAIDMEHPVSFHKPDWANTYTEEDLIERDHTEISSGYWWIELGGDDLNVINDAEEIRDELLKAAYGVWDHIKNTGEHGAENYALDWIGFLPGKRESRRIVGDYILKETDLLEGRIFDDTVAYGGWPMDMHVPGGLKTKREPTEFIATNGMYSIPYRSLYSRNIDNLFVGGRAISATHMAFGSTRVMATCGVIGQAIGTAAHLAYQHKTNSRGVLKYIEELKTTLMKDDCYLHGFHDKSSVNKFNDSIVTASSFETGAEPEKVINGYQRNSESNTNCWIAKSAVNEWINIELDSLKKIKELIVNFDSNLSRQFMISISKQVTDAQIPGIPSELVKDYKIEFFKNSNVIFSKTVNSNYLRHNHHILDETVICDNIRISFSSTHGAKQIKVFDVKIF